MDSWSTGQIEFTLINGMTGDPGLYAFFVQTGEAVLFDLGSLDNIPHKMLLKVRTICVSHTHIDHFIGFDRLLRVNIPHFRELEFCGPKGLAENIQGKLKGYLWNLVEKDQLRFRVHEIYRDGSVQSFFITNANNFAIEPCASPQPAARLVASRPLPEKPACFVTNLSDTSRIEAVALDHGTDSIAYLCQAPLRFSVKLTELERLQLTPGPWIKELQAAVADARYDETITVVGRTFKVSDLASEVLTYTAPRTLGYVTDIAYNKDNLERLATLMSDVETLVCEANFRHAEQAEATKKKHLTTREVALIAKRVRADKTRLFHMSKVYKDDTQGHLAEFEGFLIDPACVEA